MMQTIMKKVNDFFSPLRKLPYGEDGKYIHIVLGVVSVLFLMAIVLFFDMATVNLLGLSIYSLFVGVGVERMQVMFFGSGNTIKEQIFDSLWVWVGGTATAWVSYLVGFIDLIYMGQ